MPLNLTVFAYLTTIAIDSHLVTICLFLVKVLQVFQVDCVTQAFMDHPNPAICK